MSNGLGWRSVLFVSGCVHECPGCHNEEAWDFNYGEPFDYEKTLNSIKSNSLLRGLTLSGGDPMLFATELYPLVHAVKALGLDVWCYTGYTLEYLIKHGTQDQLDFLKLVDVLVDGRFVMELKDPSLRFRGSSNQRVLNMNYYWKTGGVKTLEGVES